ncbi:uncharacterized protein LOC103506210 [Diaphorina citri]|uniref:Uncharacterized protein LOC103506210 n=1 Tax=Diaphorina citri TaxID=121845 RepID=A0A1S4E7R7_DIACI|nr:uncharacterized protein LOC103506210 [Diaphorina citri]
MTQILRTIFSQKYLFYTNTLGGGVLMCLGDTIQQTIELYTKADKTGYDLKRVAHMGITVSLLHQHPGGWSPHVSRRYDSTDHSEADYPYRNDHGKTYHCQYNSSKIKVYSDKYYKFRGANTILQMLVQHGPVVALMNADLLHSYTAGNIPCSSLGPPQHFFYKYLDKYLPKRSGKSIALKLCLDQAIISPVCIIIFLYGIGILEAKPKDEIKEEVRDKFLVIYTTDCLLWPPCQFVNFTYISAHFVNNDDVFGLRGEEIVHHVEKDKIEESLANAVDKRLESILEAKPKDEIKEEVRDKFLVIYTTDCLLWPPCQFVNFTYISAQYRVIYVNLVSIVYDIMLSYIKYNDDVFGLRGEEIVHHVEKDEESLANAVNKRLEIYGMGILEAKPKDEIKEEIRDKFLVIYTTDCLLWPPCQFINFTYISPQYRVMYVNLITIVYDIMLSYIKYNDDVFGLRGEEIVHHVEKDKIEENLANAVDKRLESNGNGREKKD